MQISSAPITGLKLAFTMTLRAPAWFLSALLLTPILHAQTTPVDVEEAHRQGMSLRAQHRDAEARVLFEDLWTRTHEPRARARQALAEHALGMGTETESHLVEALAFESDPWIVQNRLVLEPIVDEARARQGISLLNVACPTPGASVFVHGRAAGSVGTPLRLLPGSTTFEVRAPGFVSVTRTVVIVSGATVTETVALEPEGAAVVAPPSNSSGQVQRTAQSTTRSVGSLTPTPPPPSNAMRVGGYIAGGLSGVALTLGFVGLYQQRTNAGRWNNQASAPDGCGLEGEQPTSTCLGYQREANLWGNVAMGGFVAGGLLGATSVILLILAPSRREATPLARTICGPGVGLASVQCAGVF